MQQDNSSFWTDIKNYEERLANAPDSFCFAKLSEVYLKVGLIDDALHTARQGVAKHPAYLSGHRALALACHAKGIRNDCLAALRLLAEAMPEDLESLKLLGRLSNEIGDHAAARQAFLTVLEFAPDDIETRLELGALEYPESEVIYSNPVDGDDDEEIIEDLEILEELDVLEEDELDSDFQFQETTVAVAPATASFEPQHDPLSTSTLAELYVSQGFIHKALEIYQTILADDPANSIISSRVAELELQSAGAEPQSFGDDDFLEEEIEGESSEIDSFTSGSLSSAAVSAVVTDHISDFQFPASGSSVSELPSKGVADNALAILEVWLDNIRRIRSCR